MMCVRSVVLNLFSMMHLLWNIFSAKYPLTSAEHFWLKKRCNTQRYAIIVWFIKLSTLNIEHCCIELSFSEKLVLVLHWEALSVLVAGRQLLWPSSSPGTVCFSALFWSQSLQRRRPHINMWRQRVVAATKLFLPGQGAPASQTPKTVWVWMLQTSSGGHGQMTLPEVFPD